MANWYHRNPLKCTSKVTFDLGLVATSIAARSICHELGALRQRLLKLLMDPALDPETIRQELQQYISLFMGFITAPENSQHTTSQLRGVIMFKWTDSVQPKSIPALVTQDEAKDVYLSLRQAAGVFKLIRDKYAPNLQSQPKQDRDLHTDILEAYINQSLAEAQEVTVGRAIELKHEPSLIAALAKETAKTYEHASESINFSWKENMSTRRVCVIPANLVYLPRQPRY
ncbi:hypothetical protein FBUS_06933 [Fasciolopsis buskii]|uniref:BRO1 domain-containing protein n=1 Tax=Fasciolopsis buskii TaxID=27845 RepID=A0A8E0RZ37_9TREM|nr:hypothetical protein FBUS_06933 [Fasciolopsis buski]